MEKKKKSPGAAMSMSKPGRKGRHDFGDRLMEYAVESGVLVRCPEHPGSVFRAIPDDGPAREVVEDAWGRGEISSGLEGALGQLEAILKKAPASCSHPGCWLEAAE